MFHPKYVEKYVSEGLKNNRIFTDHSGSNFSHTSCDLFDQDYYRFLLKTRYGNYKVAALPLLRVILRSCYNLTNNNAILFNFGPSKLNPKSKAGIVTPYTIRFDRHEILNQFNASIERYLIEFLESLNGLLNNPPTYVGGKEYMKRYVEYNDWILTALLFIYYDGRIYSDIQKPAFPIPHQHIENACSSYSLRLCLQRLLSWMDNEKLVTAEKEDYEFAVTQLYRIDEIFSFFKIKRMDEERKRIFSDQFLNLFHQRFSMTYSEIVSIRDILDEEVFKNDEFISQCLTCEKANPLFIFISFLEQNALHFNLSKTNLPGHECSNPKLRVEHLSIRELISITKEETLLFIKAYTTKQSKKLIFAQRKELTEVYYWKKYFFEDLKFLKKYAVVNLGSPVPSEVEYIDYLFNKASFLLNPKFKK